MNAFWKKSACASLFDTLFRTLGRLEPKWIVVVVVVVVVGGGGGGGGGVSSPNSFAIGLLLQAEGGFAVFLDSFWGGVLFEVSSDFRFFVGFGLGGQQVSSIQRTKSFISFLLLLCFIK